MQRIEEARMVTDRLRKLGYPTGRDHATFLLGALKINGQYYVNFILVKAHHNGTYFYQSDYIERTLLFMVLNNAIRQALTSGHLAHLVTLNQDGSPQVTLVWVGLDGDEIVSGHLGVRQKIKNIQNNARVALSMETGGKTGVLDNYLVISGRARITEGDAPELLHQLAQIYVGPGTHFPADNAPPGYIIRITVEHISGVGPWKERA